MKYKLIMFDFDGTLADTFPWFIQIIDHIAEKYQFKQIDKSKINDLRHHDIHTLVKQHGLPLWKLPIIANHVRKMMAKDIQAIPLFEGMESVIRQLAGHGARLAIVTSNACENVRGVLGPELSDLFLYWECGIALLGKPIKIQHILKQSGVPAEQAILFGDEIRDIQAAHRAGVASGAVSWGYAPIEALQAHSPTETFGTVEEILTKIMNP